MKLKLAILLPALLVNYFSFGQTRLEDLKIDTTITGFHFAADWSGTRVYTLNGQSDLSTIDPSAFSFTLFPNATYQAALEQIENLIMMSKQGGYIHSDITKTDTTINGCKTHIISFTETKNGTDYKNLVFDAVIMKGNTAIIFVCGDLNNGKYIEGFKKTFYAIKL